MKPEPVAVALDLALARTRVVREVDADLGSFHGLAFGDFALLLELERARGGRMRRVELAARLGITPSGVARQLAPLERIGLVDRESHPRDARLALAVLTEAGRRTLAEAQATVAEAAARTLGRLWSAEEQEALQRLLARVRGPSDTP
ncbi:MAG: winged helix-turn-helix transcriptional regulator [Thermoleophilia bacterium]|nr:winged helix-turn-helix transcriptional regulator [Thermoleophilia bacterium]